ncbi:DUF1120 domain-containing protein [Pseudomonas sp. PCH199]|uniref:DUF1120 domain-containing protein n=1 Tax=unclassified Pseudomonas TaxID=196821 RepID=UPI000BCE289C|nr:MULTISPECIES: DUF1120 domain-containing protein [unclassified Pseudomonas]MCW8275288.1 DUF1120 domain-containing protein [Pseudomonas sp. PCH199]PAM84168.1 hypothetical protein CES87_06090 [Pseudomonas sp. ERMR1:02]
MKTLLAALCASSLISLAPYARAASSTDLTVTGVITPVACTPSVSNGGKIDIGKVLVKDLNQNSSTQVGFHQLAFAVACNSATLFAINAIDNRAGTSSSPAPAFFGLGMTAADEKVGYFEPAGGSIQADGQAAQLIVSRNNGDTWSSTKRIASDALTSISFISGTTPIAVKNLSMFLYVTTYVAPANGLTLKDDTPMDGSATFEMKYL